MIYALRCVLGVMDLMDFTEIQIVAYDGATQGAFDLVFGRGKMAA